MLKVPPPHPCGCDNQNHLQRLQEEVPFGESLQILTLTDDLCYWDL